MEIIRNSSEKPADFDDVAFEPGEDETRKPEVESRIGTIRAMCAVFADMVPPGFLRDAVENGWTPLEAGRRLIEVM